MIRDGVLAVIADKRQKAAGSGVQSAGNMGYSDETSGMTSHPVVQTGVWRCGAARWRIGTAKDQAKTELWPLFILKLGQKWHMPSLCLPTPPAAIET